MTSKTSSPSLEDVAGQVERLIQTRTRQAVRDLQVRVVDSSVIVTGQTSTFYTKQLATQATSELIADVPFANEIEVV